MADRDTLTFLAEELAVAFQPIASAMQTPGGFRDLIVDMGWDFATLPPAVEGLRSPIVEVASMLDNGEVDDSEVPVLLADLILAFKAISDLASANGLAADFRNEFPRQLVDFVLVEHMLSQQPRWGYLLMTLGIIRLEDVPASSPRPAFVRRVFAFEDLDDLLSNPLAYFKSNYAWGQSSFDGDRLFQGLQGLLGAWNFNVREQLLDPIALAQLRAGALSPDDAFNVSLRLTFLETSDPVDQFASGTALYLLPENAGEKPGFALLPFATPGFEEPIEISDSLTLEFKGGIDLSGGVAAIVRPNEDIKFLSALASGVPSALTGSFAISLSLNQPSAPILILGSPDASRFEFGGISTTAGTRFDSRGKYEVFTEFEVEAGKIVVKPSSSDIDGFLSAVLPGNGFEVDFGLTVGFSTLRGLYFGGSGRFEIELPAHIQIGPLEILSAALAVRFSDGALPIDLAATVRGNFGVISATVEKIGLTANFTFPPARTGNLGPANLEMTFKRPPGVGIAIDAGAVSGGGFLFLDPDAGRYSGAVELAVFGFSVKAFGVIDTKFPDGGKTYSFVVIIVAEFTPVQIGFGFTLNGVGGLLGLNRSLIVEALGDAIRKGSVENLLFPHDPVRDAPSILNDLETIFPATADHQVLGPMAKLGWGTPTLITAELGIVIELPGPRIAAVGTAQASLPTREAGLVELNLAIDGVLDFPKKLFSLDASLYDSRVGTFPVTGDAAFRMSFGDEPNFAFSIGGFNPSFKAPQNFPKLRRASVDLGVNGNPSLTLSGYFALTSNTAQIGAAIALRAHGAGIHLDGHVSFDALFAFAPFSFDADLDAGLRVSFHGVGIGVHFHGHLSGPSPWRVSGDVCVSVLWWDACLSVEATFGKTESAALPQIDPWDLQGADPSLSIIGLQAAVQDARNWSGSPPPGALSVASLAENTGEDPPPIDPLGSATLRQKVVPLSQKLTKFGAFKPRTHDIFTRSSVIIGTDTEITDVTPVTDKFARDSFKEMKAAERLSAPPYDDMEAGFTLNPDVIHIGDVRAKNVQFETVLLGGNRDEVGNEGPFSLTQRHLRAMLLRSAAGVSGVRHTGLLKYVTPNAPVKVRLPKEEFAVADACAFTPNFGVTAVPTSHVRATLALEAHLSAHPEDVGRYAVVPRYELGI